MKQRVTNTDLNSQMETGYILQASLKDGMVVETMFQTTLPPLQVEGLWLEPILSLQGALYSSSVLAGPPASIGLGLFLNSGCSLKTQFKKL